MVFPVQLAPALGFVGLWGWDRAAGISSNTRTSSCAVGPAAFARERRVLRARRSQRDAPAVRFGGRHAMRIASAPHFPLSPMRCRQRFPRVARRKQRSE